MKKRVLKADGLLLLTASIWGAAFVAQRAGMDHVGPMTFNGVRFLLGALALLPLALRTPDAGAPATMRAGTALGAASLAGVALFAGASLQQMGIVTTTAGKAGFITGLYVIFVPLLGLFWRQRPGAGVWTGALLAVAGMYLLSVAGPLTISRGDFLVLLCAVAFAAHVLVVGWLAPKIPATRLALIQYVVCGVLSLGAALVTETVSLPGILDAWLPILYGGVMSVGVAYTLQVVAQTNAPPAHAAVILSLEGAFAALAGWLLLDEVLDARQLTGCALMLAGMLAVQLWPRRKHGPEVDDAQLGLARDNPPHV